MPSPTNADLLLQRETEAAAYVSELIVRLEAIGDRCKTSEETYRQDLRDRDAVAWEANRAGISQEVIAQLSHMGGGQPAVSRAVRRHRKRLAEEER